MRRFRRAQVSYTVFTDVDLSQARGLDEVNHVGPGYVDMQTLIKSRGKIPEGVPARVRGPGRVDHAPPVLDRVHEPDPVLLVLHQLQQPGRRVLQAPPRPDAAGGATRLVRPGGHESRAENPRSRSTQPSACTTSCCWCCPRTAWRASGCATEIIKARKRELHEKRRCLFPIAVVPYTQIAAWSLFYADEGIDLAQEIREYFIPDFSNWKDHDAFEAGFARLLADLKAEAGGEDSPAS